MGTRTERNKKQKSSWKKKLGITFLVILVIIIVLAGSGVGYVMTKLNKNTIIFALLKDSSIFKI